MDLNLIFSSLNIEHLGNLATIIGLIITLITTIFFIARYFFKTFNEKKKFKEYINIQIKKYQHSIDQLTESLSSEVEVQKKENKNIDILLNAQKERIKDRLSNIKSFLIQEIENKNNIGKNKSLTQKIEKRIKEIDDLIQKLSNKKKLIDNWNEIHNQLKQITNPF